MKVRIGKKLLPLFLSLLLLLGLTPTVVFAAGETTADGFTYEINGESVTITGYTGSGGNVTIPATIEGKPVTAVGERAFYNCTSLTSIEIPAGVTTIGGYTFSYCENLSSVTFREESQLATIGEGAFDTCTSLTSIEIPASVTTIGEWAFYNCTNLSSMTFTSKTAPGLGGSNVFSDCSALAAIHVPHEATGYTEANGWPEDKVRKDLHIMNHHKAEAPTCTEDGTKEYWYCPDCGGYFLDKDGEIKTDEAGIIGEKATGHAWGEPVWSWSDDGKTAEVTFTCKNDSSHVEKPTVSIDSAEKTPATCTEAGTTTYTAKVTFNGQEYTSFKDVEDIDPLGHKAEKVDGNAPTAAEPGNIEYWYCPQCDTCFKDAGLTEVITKEQTVLAPTGEAEPSKPEESTPDKPDSDIPQTGDNSNMMVWIAVMLIASAGMAGTIVYSRKRKHSR